MDNQPWGLIGFQKKKNQFLVIAQCGNEVLHSQAIVKSVLLKTISLFYLQCSNATTIPVGVRCIHRPFLNNHPCPRLHPRSRHKGIIPACSVGGLVISGRLFVPITRKTEPGRMTHHCLQISLSLGRLSSLYQEKNPWGSFYQITSWPLNLSWRRSFNCMQRNEQLKWQKQYWSGNEEEGRF